MPREILVGNSLGEDRDEASELGAPYLQRLITNRFDTEWVSERVVGPPLPQAFQPPTNGTAENGLPIYSWDQAAAQITRFNTSWSFSLGSGATVTYGFRSTAPGTMPNGVGDFSRFTEVQILAAEAALQLWADVANITFVRVGTGSSGDAAYSNNASILFGNYSTGADNAAAFAYYPSPFATGAGDIEGDVWVNITLEENANPVFGAYGAQVLLHEIGHAIGLAHPANYDASDGTAPTYDDDAVYWQDVRAFSVMSYFGSVNVGFSLNAFAAGPQMHDIAAIQRLYGANMSVRSGDTIYGFNSNTGRQHYTLTADGQSPVFCIWDAGGTDTLDLSGYSTPVEIDLRAEAFSNAGPGNGGVGNAIGNISIARGTVIENAIGGSGADTLIGNAVANILNGGAGADAMSGGAGNDTYVVDNAGDTVSEAVSQGTDTVQAAITYTVGDNVENLTLSGAGAINGAGNALNNTLVGNSAANTLDGGAGADSMTGGGGDDTYIVDNTSDTANEAPGQGTDTVQASATFTLGGNVENLVLTGGGAINGFGNILNNTITGNGAANQLNGFDGADTLDGAGGADSLFGGNGDDSYIVDNASDLTTEVSVSGGTDTVFASVTRNLTANIENLVLTGIAAITGAGNTLNNSITGNSAANTLYGFDGNDTLDGGAGGDTLFGANGDDTYIVDHVDDITVEGSPSGGVDTVLSSISRNLNANFENLTLTGTAQFGYGNILGNVMTGNASANGLYGLDGNDRLDGGAGADQMFGANGDDTYVVDNASDVTSEVSVSGGTDTVESSVARNLTANLENLILTGTDAINGAGNTLNNVITGNVAANTLFGLDGADRLDGGLGADTLQGGTGADEYVFSSALGGGNVDAINGFSVADDTIELSNAVFTGLGAGALDAGAFHIGAAAADSDDRIIYNSATGALYFDADGNGGDVAIQFATLAAGLALTANDFLVFGP